MKPLLIYCLSFSILLFSCNQDRKPENNGLVGKEIPDFKVLLPDSVTYLNPKSYALSGKPMVVIYFRSDCPYCKAQTKEVVDKIDRLSNINFLFLTESSFGAMKEFIENYHLNSYANVKVGFDVDAFAPKYYEAIAVPYLAIYGKDGKLKESFLGKVYSSQIRKISEEE